MPFKLGGWELLVVLFIVLLIFGAGKLPQVGASIGKAMREFRSSVREPEEQSAPRRKTRKAKTS